MTHINLNVRDAYLFGFLPQLVGVHFNGFQLLTQAELKAKGEIKDRLQEMITLWKSRSGHVVEQVKQVESLLRQCNLPEIASPESPSDYYLWADTIVQQTEHLFSVNEETAISDQFELMRLKWANLFAAVLGDTMHTVNLIVIASRLLHAQVGPESLNAQRETLTKMLDESVNKLSSIVERIEQAGTFPSGISTMHHTLGNLYAIQSVIRSDDDYALQADTIQDFTTQLLSERIEEKLN